MIGKRSRRDKIVTFLVILLIFISITGKTQTPRDNTVLRNALVQGIAMGLPGISVAIGAGDSIAWIGTAGYTTATCSKKCR